MTATVRRRPLDAPGCAAWNEAIRRARTAPPVQWCEWIYDNGEQLCVCEARSEGLCSGHRMVAAKIPVPWEVAARG